MGEKVPTIKEIIIAHLGDPPMYDEFPVDLSALDEKINGYVVQRFRPLKKASP